MTLKLQGAVAGNLDQLPEYQNVAVNIDRLYSRGGRAVLHRRPRSSLGHVDDEKGKVWSAILQADYVNASVFTRLHGTL